MATLVLPGSSTLAQTTFDYLGRVNNLPLERNMHGVGANVHTGFKPYLPEFLAGAVKTDSIATAAYAFRSRKKSVDERSWFGRKARFQHLIEVDSADFYLSIDPILNVQIGSQRETDSSLYINTRGFAIHGRIGQRVFIYSDFRENQAKFPDYMEAYIRSTGVVPGHGATKDFKGSGFDYAMASGYVSYMPSKYFHFRFGHGKNFIGDGYRSLLLSDGSFNYPFLRVTTQVWKIQYTNLFTSFQNIDDTQGSFAPHTYEGGYKKKFASFHYLSWNAAPRLQVGFFEGILWQSADSSSRRGFDLNYLNPVIFYRPVEFSLGSPDNAILGLNLKFKATDKVIVYAQGVADDINLKRKDDLPLDTTVTTERKGFIQNKLGYQLGVHGFDLFGIANLDVQAELNAVRPYTYAHKTPLQSYTHFAEPLAHPLGANFREWVFLADYRKNNWMLNARWVIARTGRDSTSQQHYGSDIFKSDYDAQYGLLGFGNTLLQGQQVKISNFRLQVNYLINPSYQMNLFVGWMSRVAITDDKSMTTSMLFFGLKTRLDNTYDDF
ncbi:MAG: hypothetical protein KDD36_00655 [Flavobacteriales bacterium]|nr:hypothetical protein [Flavobacteriales bacterium]